MPETDQRSGADGRDADHGLRRYFLFGQTALTGWALVAVLCLACVGTAMGAEPVPSVQGLLVADSTEVSGSAPAVDPMAVVQVGEALNPAVPLDTVTAASPPLDTVTAASPPLDAVTAASTPTGQAVPVPPRVVVGPTLAAPLGTIAPAGPAAQLRQAAFTTAAPDQRAGVAIQTAMAQLGLPYVWGGNGPTNGDARPGRLLPLPRRRLPRRHPARRRGRFADRGCAALRRARAGARRRAAPGPGPAAGPGAGLPGPDGLAAHRAAPAR